MHQQYLLDALHLATQRRGFCSPNPAVGALVVKDGEIIASGSHYAAGHPHAELVACQKLADNLQNVVLYTTLEPCCHWGKTPPCTELILQKGFKAVYYAYQDPNPKVAGKGETFLKQHGIYCEQISLPEIDSFYKSYTYWTKTQRPWVTCKLAISLDSKIADKSGKPVAITGKSAQKYTHTMRLQSDAILTSAKTIIQDDPSLNVRLENEVFAKPLYILDSNLSLPLNAKIFTTAEKITVFHSLEDKNKIDQLRDKGVDCRQVKKIHEALDLKEVLNKVGADGIHDLWVEAGGKLFTAFINERLAQKSILYVAPKLLGTEAYPAFNEEQNLMQGAKEVKWHYQDADGVCEIEW